jgi:hypothetical protein
VLFVTDVNPFAPPIHDEPRALEPVGAAAGERFFSVSRNKFMVMCLATFGLYEVYWFYQNWKRVKERTGANISPVGRAIFALFFTHALLRDVRVAAAEVDVSPRFGVQSAAWAFIILTLLNRLPEPFWMISLAAFIPLVAVQDTINDIHRRAAPNVSPNSSFSLGNWVAIGLGFVFWGLNVIAFFVPEEAVTP